MFVTYLFQKLLQNYKKCFIYTTILGKKCFARKTFITKSVLHAQQTAYISVIFNISKITFAFVGTLTILHYRADARKNTMLHQATQYYTTL